MYLSNLISNIECNKVLDNKNKFKEPKDVKIDDIKNPIYIPNV